MLFFIVKLLVLYFALARANVDFQILQNPGPKYRCFAYYGLTDSNTTYTEDLSQCSQISDDGTGFSSQYNSFAYSAYEPTEGYEQLATGGDGQVMQITIENNALGNNICDKQFEPSVAYDYSGYSFKKIEPSDGAYNIADYDQWVVEYDVYIHPSTLTIAQQQGCGSYNRKWLTTDFLYTWSNCQSCETFLNVISIIHYDPIVTLAARGPFFENITTDPGFRIQIDGPPTVPEGQWTHIALDFKKILEKYSADLCHGNGPPPYANMRGLQLISSNVNLTSTIEITNVSYVLRNDPDDGVSYPTPSYPGGETQSYCTVVTSTTTTIESFISRTSTPTPISTAMPNYCHVSYIPRANSDWTTGYTVDITITNTGTASIDGWNLTFSLPGTDNVSSYWNAVMEQSGQVVTAENVSTDATIVPGTGGSVQIGFNADGDAIKQPVATPARITLNNVPCSIN